MTTENKKESAKKIKKEVKDKTRNTLNISIRKRNFEEINNIVKEWDENNLNVSSQVCDAILFKSDLENNPHIQTLLSTLELLKAHLKNKDLFEEDYNNALLIATKNIISIKINTDELKEFLENELYFKTNTKPNNNLYHANTTHEHSNEVSLSEIECNKENLKEFNVNKEYNNKTTQNHAEITKTNNIEYKNNNEIDTQPTNKHETITWKSFPSPIDKKSTNSDNSRNILNQKLEHFLHKD